MLFYLSVGYSQQNIYFRLVEGDIKDDIRYNLQNLTPGFAHEPQRVQGYKVSLSQAGLEKLREEGLKLL